MPRLTGACTTPSRQQKRAPERSLASHTLRPRNSEAMFDRPTDLHVARVRLLLRPACPRLRRPVKKLQAEVELRQHADFAETGDPHLRAGTLPQADARNLEVQALPHLGASILGGFQDGRGRLLSVPAHGAFLKGERRRGENPDDRQDSNQTHRSRHSDPASRPLPNALLDMPRVYTKASMFPHGLAMPQQFLCG